MTVHTVILTFSAPFVYLYLLHWLFIRHGGFSAALSFALFLHFRRTVSGALGQLTKVQGSLNKWKNIEQKPKLLSNFLK